MISLDQLAIGQRGIVQRVVGNGAVVQRLFEMGLLEGETVEVIAQAPLGGPLEIRLGDYRLSLRRSEAAQVIMQMPTKQHGDGFDCQSTPGSQ
jgi:ferrous iron transport protein A